VLREIAGKATSYFGAIQLAFVPHFTRVAALSRAFIVPCNRFFLKGFADTTP
jgi:hypothetical protein